MKKQYSISGDGEQYEGIYDSIDIAIEEAIENDDYSEFYIGILRAPEQPETWFDKSSVEVWLDGDEGRDDYTGEWTEHWNRSNDNQRNELAIEIQAIMAKWLDRHDLRPAFFCVDEIARYSVVCGNAVEIK